MTSRKIVAVFDSQEAAQNAKDRLIELGCAREQVNIVDQSSGPSFTSTPNGQQVSFWTSLKEMFMPDEDRATLDETIRRGGYVLTATVGDGQADEATAILEREGAVDLEEREAQWRTEGWQGAQTAAAESTPRPTSGTAQRAALDEQAIPVVEERLTVGKREVNRGSVRVRSFIVEQPVHEEVRLRSERVEVERRPVGEPTGPVAQGSPEDLLQERTVELTENAEEAVIGKEAVVTEEVRLRKTSEEHVEEVDDRVRRTEVEVEDTRQGHDPRRPPPDAPPSRRL